MRKLLLVVAVVVILLKTKLSRKRRFVDNMIIELLTVKFFLTVVLFKHCINPPINYSKQMFQEDNVLHRILQNDP